uniref:AB hydrolase-1 domain-containing protein n=1 Tax=Timema tahoe TaxID=61484 RepID=A0A7R9IC83_9NEOP|nr:unnamed protein product [Timema tahoe]
MLKLLPQLLLKGRKDILLRALSQVPLSQPLAKDVQEIRIPVPWGHIAGKWWSPMDVKPILCLHGWQDNAGTWDTLAPLLTPGISLLAVDFPGHGLSSPYPRGQPYHQIEYIAFIRRIVNHYKWDKVSLMGHSMGSIISFMYSCTFSDDVNNFIGIDAFKPYSIAPAKLLGTWSSTLDKTLDTMNWHSRNTPTYSYKEMIDLWCKGTKNSVTRDSCEILLKRGAVSKLNDGRYSFTRDSLTKHTLGTGWTHELHLEFASNIKCNILMVRAKQGIMYEKIEYEKQALDIIKNTAGKFEHCEVEEKQAKTLVAGPTKRSHTDDSLSSLFVCVNTHDTTAVNESIYTAFTWGEKEGCQTHNKPSPPTPPSFQRRGAPKRLDAGRPSCLRARLGSPPIPPEEQGHGHRVDHGHRQKQSCPTCGPRVLLVNTTKCNVYTSLAQLAALVSCL